METLQDFLGAIFHLPYTLTSPLDMFLVWATSLAMHDILPSGLMVKQVTTDNVS